MIFLFILFINFKAIAAELSVSLPSPFFKDETLSSPIPVPFFINNGECIFLPPFSSDIWDKKILDDFFHNRLTFSEKQKITRDEKRYLNPSIINKHYLFQIGELKYFFTPIIAPSLKKFLLSNLKNQQKSPCSLKELFSIKTETKIVNEYLDLLDSNLHFFPSPALQIMNEGLDSIKKDLSVYHDCFKKHFQTEKHLENQLIQEEKNNDTIKTRILSHPYTTRKHKIKKSIISQQKKQEEREKKLVRYLRGIAYKISLAFQVKRWEWIKLFDKYPEFRNPTKWEEIYPSPPHSS